MESSGSTSAAAIKGTFNMSMRGGNHYYQVGEKIKRIM
jgi:hypothetical protein